MGLISEILEMRMKEYLQIVKTFLYTTLSFKTSVHLTQRSSTISISFLEDLTVALQIGGYSQHTL